MIRARIRATIASHGDEEVAPRGLIWVSDDSPGIHRIRVGEAFAYRGVDGSKIRNAAELRRIASLAVPPGYQDVWRRRVVAQGSRIGAAPNAFPTRR